MSEPCTRRHWSGAPRPPTAPWPAASRAWFADQLANQSDAFAAFVVDDPELGVVSDAVGLYTRHAPSPMNAAGPRGEVFNVSTGPISGAATGVTRIGTPS